MLSRTFNDENEYLHFPRKDPSSGWLLLSHKDQQVVANIYKIMDDQFGQFLL